MTFTATDIRDGIHAEPAHGPCPQTRAPSTGVAPTDVTAQMPGADHIEIRHLGLPSLENGIHTVFSFPRSAWGTQARTLCVTVSQYRMNPPITIQDAERPRVRSH